MRTLKLKLIIYISFGISFRMEKSTCVKPAKYDHRKQKSSFRTSFRAVFVVARYVGREPQGNSDWFRFVHRPSPEGLGLVRALHWLELWPSYGPWAPPG